ncbi:endonuclease/exonuclease/phosphatase family protein [Vibrio sagamiensis]|uniref:Hydrolase n=1 Tax=Vibrio sagamiensis NBRC 104589 TaxID=1219064 RepID=A0A511QGF1_9VIBR|nr:endonuclease/exonuclease/phosphatase family protein [Vibrio sagamiensis]PNQ67425.1 endonuclease/exonuclease/phosphatase family protein [Vibrio agarivorans]GEM76385.1 hydrolase [Vibrio sagamiensis NBRC 104589]
MIRICLLLTVLLFSRQGIAQNPSFTEPLKFTSWNFEWLSSGKGKVIRDQHDFTKLSQYMQQLSPDVLAFQEVDSTAAIRKVVGDNYTIYLSDRTQRRYQSLQFRDINQYTGFAVRKGLDVIDEPDFSVTKGRSKLRFASYVVLNPNKKNEIHLLSVHLKAGCSGAYKNSRDCKILKQQGQALAKWMKERASKKQKYAVLGDFNHNLAYPGDWLWSQISRGNSAKLMTKNTPAKCKVRSKKKPNKTHRFRSLIDHIIVSNAVAASASTQTPFKSQDVLDYTLSDHCPISTILQ